MYKMYYIGDEEIEALKILFQKKSLFRYSAQYKTECDLFENEFAEWMGSSHSLILSSGTNALVAALMASGIQPGDEVLIPTYTFIATAAAVFQVGAVPVLVNIDENLSLDFLEAQQKLNPSTKALILVHMDGLVANIQGALDFCKNNNLIFIEDAAQAIGGSFLNKKLGSFGLFGCYSFNDNKNISCGEGGALITNNLSCYEKAFCFHDTPVQLSPSKKDLFKHLTPFIGSSMRVSEIQGTLMRVQLKRLDQILKLLRERKSLLVSELQHINSLKIISGYDNQGDCGSSLHLLFQDPLQALQIGQKLRAQGLTFSPVTLRPAHVGWKWSHLLLPQNQLQPNLDEALNKHLLENYHSSHYLKSIDLLNRLLRMEININLSLEETKNIGKTILSCLNN